jgi:hypothetical protein
MSTATASKMKSACGSMMFSINSLTEKSGVRSVASRAAAASAAGSGFAHWSADRASSNPRPPMANRDVGIRIVSSEPARRHRA